MPVRLSLSTVPVRIFIKQEKISIHAQINNMVFEDEYTEVTSASESDISASSAILFSPSEGSTHFEKKAMVSEETERETKIITPALKDESIIVPTAPITKAGPALTEESAILFASEDVILFRE